MLCRLLSLLGSLCLSLGHISSYYLKECRATSKSVSVRTYFYGVYRLDASPLK
jgi:hypothetical protein